LPSAKQRVDFVGALTITGSLMAAVYALAKVPDYGWGGANTLWMFSLAAALMAAFIVNERLVKHPLINLSIFKRRNVSGGTVMQILMPAAMFSMFFYMSIYLQTLLHYTPTETGIANVPFTLTIIAVAGTLSRRVAKINTKPFLVIAPLFVAGGLLYLSRLPLHSNYWVDLLPGIVVMAIGMAIGFVLITVTATSGVDHKESGLVSGLLNTAQQIGGAIGLAVLSVISTQTTKDKMVAAHGNPAALPDALVHGFQQGFRAAVLFAIAGSLVALVVLKSKKPNETLDQEREGEAEALAAIPGA
jgi:predicted MFS family arabinose efflux permease